MDAADALEALSNILEKLTANPFDIAVHAENVRIARATGMQDQIESALDMVTTFWASGENIWSPLIEYKLQSENLETLEGIQAVLTLFERAERDYLSIPILQKHVEFLIDRHGHFATTDTKPENLGELFSTQWTSDAIEEVVDQGVGHLTQSHVLWDMRRDWELEILQEATAEEKSELIPHMESMFLDRLRQPHSDHEDTFQTYSSFTTNYKPPDEYEPILVQASKIRSQAVKSYERRETYESSLAQTNFSLEGYAYYIAAERRAKTPDLFVLTTLYERAIAEADKRRFDGHANAEEALRSFWTGYVDTLRINEADEDAQLKVLQRATRSIPGSGELWARYMRFLERTANENTTVSSAYEIALSFKPIQSDVEQLVPLILARAGYEKRKVEAGEAGEDGLQTLVTVLLEGIEKVREASAAGDPRMRLEKFFSAICVEAEMSEHAITLWEDAAKHYKTSYLAWTAYTDVLIRLHMYEDARKVFKDISMKNLDWPEAIWEAWFAFEQLYGSIQEIDECLDRIERARKQVNARRAKDAERAAYAAMQVAAEQQAASVPVAEVPLPTNAGEGVAMDVDAVQPGSEAGHVKRKAEEDIDSESSKRPKTEQKPLPLKRDRENSTVFVADLPTGAVEDDLSALFKDCGSIREIKITELPNALVATVEFMDRESVPAALTKDKKRVHDHEIAVHLAWRSTLYVTNFPEKADDTFVRDLFGKYGVIFDVRWPSKKFKSTRRFCYVQYTLPSSAQAALELNGRELEPGHPMSVLISNPERKKERTDSDANEREVYVAGLSKFVTKEDLRKLFSTYGTIKDVRMALDNNDHSRGFAFVEFEQQTDAVAALAANNYELKKRRMAVTLADTRFRAKNSEGNRARQTEAKARSIRIKNLPEGTQEGLLQQALEKRAAIKRVEVFADKNEAVAELESVAEAGKLLLHPDPLVFNGNILTFVEETLEGSRSRPAGPSMATGGLFVPRSAVSRPRAGIGSRKPRGGPSSQVPRSSAPVSSSGNGSGSKAKGQDEFRKMLSGGI